MRCDLLPDAVKLEEFGIESFSQTNAKDFRTKRGANAASTTANAPALGQPKTDGSTKSLMESCGQEEKHSGPPAPASSNTSGKSQGLWATPRADKLAAENLDTWAKRNAEGKVSQQPLPTQVQNWPTPDTQNHRDGTKRRKDSLNPNFVEQLMGLPVGWTQLPTELTASASSGMESSPQPAR